MNTDTSRPAPRPRRRDWVIALTVFLALPLLVGACEILEVLQPSQADQGEIIEVMITVEKFYSDQNPWRGIVSVLVPEDWTYVSGTYGGELGTGDMLEDEGWADSTEIVLPAPAGMKWIATISDVGYTVPEPNTIVDATLRFQVGQQLGTFDLGYFVTTSAFATGDIDFGAPDQNTADTLMNQPITVTSTVANEGGADQPEAFALAQNYPNPFNPATTIRYTLAHTADVTLTVLDVTGREVAALNEGRRTPGSYALDFDARALSSGTYLYQLRADGEVVATRRMTLAK